MIETFFNKIASGIFTLLLAIASIFGDVPVKSITYEDLGAQAVGGEVYFLGGSGVTATQTTVDLTKFGYTQPNGVYYEFEMANFGGALGCGTLEPGINGKQEFVSFTGITQNANNTAQLTGITRGLQRFPDYTSSTTLRTAHAGGTKFVISNSPPCFYETYANRQASTTIESRWTFTTVPESTRAATTSNQLATKSYVDNTNNVGAATSTESTGGIVELATRTEQASTTGAVTDALVLQARNATSTPGADITATGGTGETFVVVAEDDGKINQSWIDLTEGFAFTGNNTQTGSTTLSGVTTINASTTILASQANRLTLNGVDYTFPVTEGASTTALLTNGGGRLIWGSVNDWEQLTNETPASATSSWSIPIGARRNFYKMEFYLEANGSPGTATLAPNIATPANIDGFSILNATSTNSFFIDDECQLNSGDGGDESSMSGTIQIYRIASTTIFYDISTIAFRTDRWPLTFETKCTGPTPTLDFWVFDSPGSGDWTTNSRVTIWGSRD